MHKVRIRHSKSVMQTPTQVNSTSKTNLSVSVSVNRQK